MDRAIRSQVQCCLLAGALVLAACAPGADRLVSAPFRLEPRQMARLTVRHIRFCADAKDLRVALAFTNHLGRTLARRDGILRCGESAQLNLAGEVSVTGPVTAQLEFRPLQVRPPEAAVEVSAANGLIEETMAVYVLRKEGLQPQPTQAPMSDYPGRIR